MKKLAIIHTTPVTVDSLKQYVAELIPDCETINIVDDTILPQLNDNGGNIAEIKPRWEKYAAYLEERGADAILSACSSVGGLVDLVQPSINVPVLRIDEAMAEYAVNQASKIGVAATLETTLEPTMNLLQQKADKKGKKVDFIQQVASSAYQKLMAGDQQGHDRELAEVLHQLAKETEVIVLAQASMARVVSTFPAEMQGKFLTSPKLGIEAAREKLFQ